MKHVSESPIRPSERAAGVDPGLEAICLKAISKKPTDRYQSAREMRQALLDVASKAGFGPVLVLSSAGPSSRPSSRPPAPLRRHDSSKPTLAGVAPGTPAPRARRSRGWLALLLVPAAAAALLVRYRAALFGDAERAEPAPSAKLAAPVSSLSAALVEPEPVELPTTPDPSGSRVQHAPSNKRHGKAESSVPVSTIREAAASLEATPSLPAPPATVELAPVSNTDSRAASPAIAPPASPPTAPKYDPTLARVTIGAARNVVGATAASVTRAVSEASTRIAACYKSALPQLGSTFEGADVLHVDTDGSGIIIDARLNGPIRGSVASCVAAAVQGHRVANVDTGNASADVPISFRDH